MLTLIFTANVIVHVYLYIVLYRIFKKTGFYKKLVELHLQLQRVPAVVKDKRDLRKARKYRPYVKLLRSGLVKLLVINTVFFLAVYASILVTTTYLAQVFGVSVLEVPIVIPLLTMSLDGKLYTHVYVVVLLALMLMLYPILREAKIKPSM